MGAVKIDFTTKEKPFKDMSYSSVEDLEKILFMFDLIEHEKNKFNFEALAIYTDMLSLVDSSKHEIVYEYITIQTGKKPLTEHEDNILITIAARKGITIDECKKRFIKELKNIVKVNKENWIDSLLNCNIYHTKKHSVKIDYVDLEQENIKLDYALKYISPSRKYPEVTDTADLDELIQYQKYNEQRIEEILKIKPKERTFQQKGELNKRIKWNKQLSEDIRELQFHYGLINEDKYAKKKDTITNVRVQNFDEYNLFDEWEVQRIKDVAVEKLTDKQYIIFSLYYQSGFTQQEIADILGELQANIAHDIRRIKRKLKKYK